MSWIAVSPVFSKRPECRALVRVSPKGRQTLFVSLPTEVMERAGQPTTCQAEAGAGEHEGQLRLTFGMGPYQLNKGGRGKTGRVAIPIFPGVPATDQPSHICEVVAQDRGLLILKLPLDRWSTAGTKRIPPPAGPAEKAPDAKVQVVAYLTGKGHSLRALAAGRWQVDGEIKQPLQVLKLVNLHRTKAELPEALLEDLDFG